MVDGESSRYRRALRFLDTLTDWERRVGLRFTDEMMRLDLFRRSLDSLGHPERRFRVVLVAGTKGKGSTASILARLLTEHGVRTGLSTSPHLVSPRERIAVGGANISRGEFAGAVEELRRRFDFFDDPGRSRTWFEAITAVSFLHFARKRVDTAVLEVGLGGRLDATNVTEPALSVITTIGHDHTHILGSGLLKIAGEKGAVMREGAHAVFGRQRPRVGAFLRRRALEIGAVPSLAGEQYEAVPRASGGGAYRFDYSDREGRRWEDLPLSLLGEHQVGNAAAALRAFTLLEERPDEGALRRALGNVSWPARGELFRLVGGDVLLDGAHNADSAAVLGRLVDEIRPGGGHVLLFGGSKKKKFNDIFRHLLPLVVDAVFTESSHPRRESAVLLERRARRIAPAIGTKVIPDAAEALRAALGARGKGRLLVITGSLHLAGDLRADLVARRRR